MLNVKCKAEGCNTIVATSDQDFCRSCLAKLATLKTEVKSEVDEFIGEDGELEPTLEESFGLLDATDKRRLARALNTHVYGMRPKTLNGYLPFQVPNPVPPSGIVLIATPQCLFKPEALMLWGWDDTTVVRAAYIGQQVQGAASFGELPAAFFGTAKTYEKLIEDLGVNGISPPNWITWSTAHVGQNVHIDIKGPLRHAVMLGKLAY